MRSRLRPRGLRDIIAGLLEGPADVVRQARDLRILSSALADLPADKARYYPAGLTFPASIIYSCGQIGDINPGEKQDLSINLQRRGAIVGLMIQGRGIGQLSIEVENNNMTYQLTREASIGLAASARDGVAVAAEDAFASVAGMTALCPWFPVLIPVRGAGQWTLTIRNIHPQFPIRPLANLAMVTGDDMYHRACAALVDDESDEG